MGPARIYLWPHGPSGISLLLCLPLMAPAYFQTNPDNKVDTLNFRIYEEAPRGTLVSVLNPQELIPGVTSSDVRFSVGGKDRRKFAVEGNSLITSAEIRRRVGQRYLISLEVTSRSPSKYVMALWNVTIEVSKKNLYAPRFPQDFFTAEVYRASEVGKRILKITAQDIDHEPYNSRTYYSLGNGDLNSLFAIENDTGWLKTAGSLQDAKALLHLQVIAMDTGSPPMTMATTVTLILREIEEPNNVTVYIANMTTVKLCWKPPKHGSVQKYIVSFALGDTTEQQTKGPSLTALERVVVRAGRKRTICTSLVNLRAKREYWSEIRALDGGKSGVPVRVWFETIEDSCSRSPCGHGTCVLIPEPPGYRCEHQCDKEECDENVNDGNQGECDEELDEDCKETSTPLICKNGGELRNNSGTPFCLCPEGLAGKSCEFRDLCLNNVCKNGASCETISSTQFQCFCTNGWYGENCEYFNPCSQQPCRNGGQCNNITETEYECICSYGYFSKNCTRYNPCSSGPCQNNGGCHNISDYIYVCQCLTGYHGYDCENYNPCYHEPCEYGGMCNSVDGEYVCECGYGRYGRHCEHMNLCEYMIEPCGTHADGCKNTSDSTYQCICSPGWSGHNCSEYDPCHSSPCLHDNMCVSKHEREYSCRCQDPYYGHHCEKTNPCVLLPCKNGGLCANTTDSDFICSCPDGYYGQKCERYNPCVKALCLNGGHCMNTSETAYQCQCLPQYTGDICQYFNSCFTDPCKYGRCVTLDNGKHECACEGGYTGPECQYFDPCASGPCQHGGVCYNTSSVDRLCQCRAGFHGVFCERFDACQSNPCREGTCMSLEEGGFHCVCPKGMFGPTCESTDPCTGNPCLHHGTCISTHGPSFRCICPSGYYGPRCENFNPCVSNPCHNLGTCRHPTINEFICDCKSGFQGELCQSEIPCDGQYRSCINQGTCLKDEHGYFFCKCIHGFTGSRCEHFNACDSKTPCLNGGSCVKIGGGRYECQCTPGFFGERCEYHTPCLAYVCRNNGTCVQTPTGDQCKCLQGFEGTLCEVDIDECLTVVCENQGSCSNIPGTFRCICTPGYEGKFCQSKARCPEEVVYDATGTYTWPEIQQGQSSQLPCPRNQNSVALRTCDIDDFGMVTWSEADTSACVLEVINLNDTDQDVRTSEEALRALAPFKNGSIALKSGREVAAAAELIETILPIAQVDKQVASDMLDVIDQILELPVDSLLESNSTGKLLELLEDFQHGVQLRTDNYTLSTTNMEIFIVKLTSVEKQVGVAYTPTEDNNVKGDGPVQIELPPEVFNDDTIVERAQFSFFKTGKFFMSSNGLDVGDVISASIGHEVKNLRKCVMYTLPNPKELPKKCVYYDPEIKAWSTYGVKTITAVGTTIKCCSKHLSYFAMISDPEWSAVSKEQEFLSFLASFCGTGISILFLFIVLLTYSLFRSLNKENFGQVVMQLSLSMLLWNVTILIGFNREQVDNDTVCMSVAVITHYLTLSTLLWVSAMGHHVYQMLGREAASKDRCFICKRILFAWVIPALIVGIPLGVDMDVYKGDNKRCLMSPINRYLYCGTYLTPSCIVLVANFVLFCMVVKTSLRSKYEMKSFVIGVSQIRGTCIIIALTGISWVLGYIAEMDKIVYFSTYIYEYAFFGANTFLGICVFLFYCLLRRDACVSWKAACCSSKRRRVAGKNSLGATTMKSEGSDYTLVVDRKLSVRHLAEEEKMLEPDLSSYRRARDHSYGGPSRSVDMSNNRQPRQYRAVDTDSCPASPSISTRRSPRHIEQAQRDYQREYLNRDRDYIHRDMSHRDRDRDVSHRDRDVSHRDRDMSHRDRDYYKRDRDYSNREQGVELATRPMSSMGWITHHNSRI